MPDASQGGAPFCESGWQETNWQRVIGVTSNTIRAALNIFGKIFAYSLPVRVAACSVTPGLRPGRVVGAPKTVKRYFHEGWGMLSHGGNLR